MAEQTLKEKIFTIVDGANFKQGATTEEATTQILNLLKEELEGLTVMGDNPYFLRDRDGGYYNKYPEFEVYDNAKKAQLQHTINEIKEKMG